MTAPVASGWSVRRVGLAPTGKRRLLTAHTYCGRSGPRPWTPQMGGEADLQGRQGRRGVRPEREFVASESTAGVDVLRLCRRPRP